MTIPFELCQIAPEELVEMAVSTLAQKPFQKLSH